MDSQKKDPNGNSFRGGLFGRLCRFVLFVTVKEPELEPYTSYQNWLIKSIYTKKIKCSSRCLRRYLLDFMVLLHLNLALGEVSQLPR